MRQSSFTALLTPTGELLPDIKDLPFYEVVIEKQEVFTAPGEKMNSIGKNNSFIDSIQKQR